MERKGIIIVDRKSLMTGLRLVRHAAARDESRPMLRGVSIYQKEDGMIDVVAADGSRIAIYTTPAIINGKFIGVFPLSLIVKLEESKREEVVIDIVSAESRLNMVRIDGEGIELLFDSCPDFRQCIPKELICKATFTNEEFKAALDAVKVLAKRNGGAVRLETTERGILKVWAEFETEVVSKEIQATIEGSSGKTAIYWRNLRDVLNAKTNTISFNSLPSEPSDVMSFKPCIFTGPNFIEVVMPMHITW